jgi:hypothetical protein
MKNCKEVGVPAAFQIVAAASVGRPLCLSMYFFVYCCCLKTFALWVCVSTAGTTVPAVNPGGLSAPLSMIMFLFVWYASSMECTLILVPSFHLTLKNPLYRESVFTV